ncbi:MAG: iron-containing alcohol dehydrogenase [Alphaproteobacteria bacterium]
MTAMIATPKLMFIGGGALDNLLDCMDQLGAKRPLIVTDPMMVELGKVAQVTDRLETAGHGFEVFSDTVPDPTTDVIEAGAAILKDGDFDCLIALGGGSPMDTAKAMNVLACAGGKMRDYKVPATPNMDVMPLICVPTTAGTGSEVTKIMVITDTESGEKMLMNGLACLPTAAIIDYTLTMSVPYRTTADTGIDSLTHAMEAYVSQRANPYSDSVALSAMQRLYTHIRTACTDPDNETAREQMMLGATQGGMAFSNASVCLVHGMSRPLGAFFHIPHGLSNAMLLPAVTEFSAPNALSRYADCARVMGIATDAEGDQLAVNKLLEALVALNQDLQVPTPKDYGIDESMYFESIPTMAEQAIASGSPGNNPRVPTAEEIAALYEKVWA